MNNSNPIFSRLFSVHKTASAIGLAVTGICAFALLVSLSGFAESSSLPNPTQPTSDFINSHTVDVSPATADEVCTHPAPINGPT